MTRAFTAAAFVVAGFAFAQPVLAAAVVTVSVPEPSSIALLATGLVGLGGLALRRRDKKSKD